MQYSGDFQSNAQGIEMGEGTNAEEFTLGETVTFASGVLTKAAVDSDGTQNAVVLATVTGATGVANVPYIKISENNQFSTVSSATVAATLIGAAVTLNADAIRVTATTTKGIFVIDETDGTTTTSKVKGHFVSAGAL